MFISTQGTIRVSYNGTLHLCYTPAINLNLPFGIRGGRVERGGRESRHAHLKTAVEADASPVEPLMLTVVEVIALVALVALVVLARHVVRVVATLVLLVGTRTLAVVAQRDTVVAVI